MEREEDMEAARKREGENSGEGDTTERVMSPASPCGPLTFF